MNDEEIMRKARQYLEPLREINLQIRSRKEELRFLRSDIVSLSAIDYSKERISGGGDPVGIDLEVAKLVDRESQLLSEMSTLLRFREEARGMITKVADDKARIFLLQYYILGKSAKSVNSFTGYEKTQASEYKRVGLLAIGEQLKLRTTAEQNGAERTFMNSKSIV